MLNFLIKNFKIKSKFDIGEKSFLFGVFFLSSALPLSIIFFLVSIIISLNINKLIFLKDKYNRILFLCSGLMIISCLNSILNLSNITNQTALNIFISLGNWLPMFILFFSSQIYLKTYEKRKVFSKFVTAGTVPVIFSCALQYIFNIYGPFETLNGLIVWYQEPLGIKSGVTGLFSNQNYTGFWLSSLMVFSIYEMRNGIINSKNKIVTLLITASLAYFSILTNSRNAVLGLLISIFSSLKRKYLLLLPIGISIVFALKRLILNNLYNFYYIFDNSLLSKLFTFDIANYSDYPRLKIYSFTFKSIFEKPIFGWGPSTFSTIDKSNLISNFQHSHNIILELAFSFGIPLTIIMGFFLLKLIKNTFIKTFKNGRNSDAYLINKTWYYAVIIVVASQISDITYYDGKISILIWILLAGIKCIVEERNSKELIIE